MAAFVDGRLHGPAHRRLLMHLLGCDDCLALVLDVVADLHAPASARHAAPPPNTVTAMR